MMKNANKGNPQESLFGISTDAALMHSMLSMPKIDLHRHLTGSIKAATAVRIAAKYTVKLPTYIISELEDILYNSRPVNNLKEYFSPWPILNRLFCSNEATRDLIFDTIRDAAEDNVVYLELRMGPHGFLGNGPFAFEEFVETVSATVAEADKKFGTITRCILGIPRHVFGSIPFEKRKKMFARMISTISPLRPYCFVGVDINGDEAAVGAEEFEVFFKIAKENGFKITVHAGECGPASNVQYALEHLNAMRIGHGLAAASNPSLLKTLSKRKCALEICPTSNRILGLVSGEAELPLKILRGHGVPFVVCSDNPARCKTTLSEEIFKIAKTFMLSPSEIRHIVYSSLDHCFADPETKERLKLKLDSSV